MKNRFYVVSCRYSIGDSFIVSLELFNAKAGVKTVLLTGDTLGELSDVIALGGAFHLESLAGMYVMLEQTSKGVFVSHLDGGTKIKGRYSR